MSSLTASVHCNSAELFDSLLWACDSAPSCSLTVFLTTTIMCVCLYISWHVVSAAVVQVFITFTNLHWASNTEGSDVRFAYGVSEAQTFSRIQSILCFLYVDNSFYTLYFYLWWIFRDLKETVARNSLNQLKMQLYSEPRRRLELTDALLIRLSWISGNCPCCILCVLNFVTVCNCLWQ